MMSSKDVVGFYFLDLATSYQPPPDLVAFLEAGPPPVYIGYVFPYPLIVKYESEP